MYRKANRKGQKLSALSKMAENLPSVSGYETLTKIQDTRYLFIEFSAHIGAGTETCNG